MTIEESKASIIDKYGWRIHEDTVLILDEEYCLWIAQVTTTRRHEAHQGQFTFPILVSETEVFAELDSSNLQALGEWCLKQETSNTNTCSRDVTQVEQ
jgi:hypothetical protein